MFKIPIFGEKGTGCVAPVQRWLKNANVYFGDIDDWFLNQTKDAIKLFQQREKLEITGVLDEKTFLLLQAKHQNPQKQSLKYSLQIGETPFIDFFNRFRFTAGMGLFPHHLQPNFNTVIGKWQKLTGLQELSLNDFVAHFCIIYNETGGSFLPLNEWGGHSNRDSFVNDAYYFRTIQGKKLSYNQSPNLKAGDLLKNWGIITKNEDITAWNSTTVYPTNQPEFVRRKARDCDFYKFRGRGLNQITWRNGYIKYVNPSLANEGFKASELMTEEELTKAFQNPDVYCGVFRQYINDSNWAGRALESIRMGIFTEYPKYVAGFFAHDYHALYVRRATALKRAIQNQFNPKIG